MTTPKLHPAAVKAADELGRNQEDRESGAEIIHAAIDDHLKSKEYAKWWLRSVHTTHRGLLKREGWEELRDAALAAYVPDPEARDRLLTALVRVRGEKP